MADSPKGEFLTTNYTDCTDFFIFSREFALFAVGFGSTMRNPKEPLYRVAEKQSYRENLKNFAPLRLGVSALKMRLAAREPLICIHSEILKSRRFLTPSR